MYFYPKQKEKYGANRPRTAFVAIHMSAIATSELNLYIFWNYIKGEEYITQVRI